MNPRPTCFVSRAAFYMPSPFAVKGEGDSTLTLVPSLRSGLASPPIEGEDFMVSERTIEKGRFT